MTAYGISPVGANGVERHREQRIDIPSRLELVEENGRLRALLAETVDAREAWHTAWKAAVEQRLADRDRLQRAMRILSAMENRGPAMAAAVAAARSEIWRLDE